MACPLCYTQITSQFIINTIDLLRRECFSYRFSEVELLFLLRNA